MKKKILGRLSLGKRTISSLSSQTMSQFNGGYYTGSNADCQGNDTAVCTYTCPSAGPCGGPAGPLGTGGGPVASYGGYNCGGQGSTGGVYIMNPKTGYDHTPCGY
jgi:natural product precursor